MDNNKYCRACMRIFSEEDCKMDLRYQRSKIESQFVECSGCKVPEESDPPRYLCIECSDKTVAFYKFKQMCINSMNRWMSLRPIISVTSTDECRVLDISLRESTSIHKKHKKCKHPVASNKKIQQKYIVKDDIGEDEELHEIVFERISFDESPEKKEKIQCTLCPRVFLLEDTFQDHMREHQGLGSRTYTCNHTGCNSKYFTRKEMNEHLVNFHASTSTQARMCEVCGKVLKTSHSLRSHRLRHKDRSEWPLKCDYPNCGHRFIVKANLDDHKARHAGVRNFKCPHCDMTMVTAGDMRRHINLHTREVEYPCKICAKIFYSSAQMNMHIRKVHKKGLVHPCKYCRYSFRSEEMLEAHEKGHEGKIIYDCSECSRTFTQPRFRTLHMQKKHNQKISKKTSAEVYNDEIDFDDHSDDFNNYGEEYLISFDENDSN